LGIDWAACCPNFGRGGQQRQLHRFRWERGGRGIERLIEPGVVHLGTVEDQHRAGLKAQAARHFDLLDLAGVTTIRQLTDGR